MPFHAHEKIGRNDPCACASGRKYKHCCLPNTPSIDRLWARQHEDSERLIREMMRFAARKFGEQIDDAWQDFNMSDIPEPFEKAAEEHRIFMPYFLFHWNPDRRTRRKKVLRNGGVVARWYMLEKSKQLTETERLLLEQATTQPISFYEVLWSKPGDRMVVRDVLMGGETEVIERSASRTLRAGDIIYAQIWYLPELAVLGCCAPLAIPPDKKVQVIELRKELRKRIAKLTRDLTANDLFQYADTIRAEYLNIRDACYAPPRFCNTDGDPLLFHTLTFRIGSAEAAFESLASLSVGRSRETLLNDAELDENGQIRSVDFDWIREGNRKLKNCDNTILGHIRISEGRLIAEVNSEHRARQLRREIERRLGSIGAHQSTVAQTLDEMQNHSAQQKTAQAESRDAEVAARLLDPEVRNHLQLAMQKQVEGWVYQKIPALGGHTPIEAVRDPDGKEAVEALLLQWERYVEKDLSPNQIRPDINAVRRLLNLSPSVSRRPSSL